MSVLDQSISTLGNCTQVQPLSPGHPVFLLVFQRGSLVVKAESPSSSAVHNNTTVMRFVDRQSRTVVLKNADLASLSQIATNMRSNELTAALSRSATWVKMEAKRGLVDLGGAADKRLTHGDKTDVRKFAAALAAPGGLEKLGKVLAADAFNGNLDRVNFNPHQQGGNFPLNPIPGVARVALQCVQNVGNLFIATESNGDEVVGLDMFDPNSHFRDWSVPLATSEANAGEPWSGRLLHANAQAERRTLATKLVADLETILGPRDRKIPGARKSRLPAGAVGRIVLGIEQGADRIEQKLVRGRAPVDPHPKVGLTDRLRALNWIP